MKIIRIIAQDYLKPFNLIFLKGMHSLVFPAKLHRNSLLFPNTRKPDTKEGGFD
jgi:hypothetical protein